MMHSKKFLLINMFTVLVLHLVFVIRMHFTAFVFSIRPMSQNHLTGFGEMTSLMKLETTEMGKLGAIFHGLKLTLWTQ